MTLAFYAGVWAAILLGGAALLVMDWRRGRREREPDILIRGLDGLRREANDRRLQWARNAVQAPDGPWRGRWFAVDALTMGAMLDAIEFEWPVRPTTARSLGDFYQRLYDARLTDVRWSRDRSHR